MANDYETSPMNLAVVKSSLGLVSCELTKGHSKEEVFSDGSEPAELIELVPLYKPGRMPLFRWEGLMLLTAMYDFSEHNDGKFSEILLDMVDTAFQLGQKYPADVP